ncbi:uncharacterized protein PHALS_03897 [Plasmopara halstedii]|uniref:Uncharacterized protein n=1 Tax=Plasmopara halstedii TaxID=4781 RepID=A0A0P1AZU0_PLAHL|nr:uncharacterized protein PHALS_03897 [Plasmopara halstedii]CEG47250.1 hypothetical protein PHALS_03897 [Plasmopara halstedii]|eukprot:XP_024583619.1 hypothetical protein PHALS_03897 [Plasmopara halstedii]
MVKLLALTMSISEKKRVALKQPLARDVMYQIEGNELCVLALHFDWSKASVNV